MFVILRNLKLAVDGVPMSKQEVAAERKNQIVQATVECISTFGYHNFSMQDVAKTAGVSKGIIHYYFLNKDDLMMSVLKKVASDIETVIQTDMESSSDPSKKLEIFIEICLDVVRNTREYYQVNMDFWTQINQKKEVKLLIAQHYTKFRETCASVIQEGIEKNIFKHVDAKLYASLIIAIIDGVSLQWLFDEDSLEYKKLVKLIYSVIIENLKL